MNGDRQIALTTTWAALIMLVANFLPWVTLEMVAHVGGVPAEGMPPINVPFGEISADGWASSLNLNGLKIPNWMALVYLCSASIACWLNEMNVASVRKFVPVSLGLLALGHPLAALLVVVVAKEGSIGAGVVFGLLAGIIAVVSTLSMRDAQDVSMAPMDSADPA